MFKNIINLTKILSKNLLAKLDFKNVQGAFMKHGEHPISKRREK